jgi:chromosome transmission fidelity protein 18
LNGTGGGNQNNEQSEFLNPKEPSSNKQSYNKKYDSDDEDFSRNNKDDLSDDDGDKSKKEKNLVKRPIICICNDLYAKVLMHLRKEALVFNVKADPNKLERRLKEICVKEKLNIDVSTIKNLCKQTNYDIRACINTLQFISYNQNNLALMKTLSMDKLQMLGSKDITAGLFEIWNKIFMSSLNPMELTFKSTLGIYNSYGEFERINDGIYVNYINNPTSKNELQNRAKLLEFLSYDDVLTSKINSGHNYEMSKFQCLPGAFAKIKYSSTDKNKNLKFPTFLIDYKKSKKNNFRIISSIKEAFDEECPYSKIGKKSLICDTLPFVYQLIQPEIREINPELMNKKELKQLRTAINIMCQFGIKFHEGRPNEDGEEEDEKIYEPDLSQLLNFSQLEKIEEIEKKNFFNKGNSFSKNKFSNQSQDIESLNKNTRITSKQKFIIRGEYEKLKSYKNNIKDTQQINNNSLIPKNQVQDERKNEKLKKSNFFESQSKKNQDSSENTEDVNKKTIINNMNFGRKRNFSQFADPEYKFVYKFNEGVTNTVRRTLNLNYFFKQ